MASNPLSSTRKSVAPQQHPMMGHAQVWQHVNNMSPDDMKEATANSTHALPILGKLAFDPDVTRKDVIKAAADAAGAGKLAPSQAVHIISEMPDDPDKLQPWLRNLYAFSMTAAVHMKAAQMPDQAPQGAAPQQPVPQGVPQQ